LAGFWCRRWRPGRSPGARWSAPLDERPCRRQGPAQDHETRRPGRRRGEGLACTHSGPRVWGPHDGESGPGLRSQVNGGVAGACETRARPVMAFSGGAASSCLRMWKQRASSRRAIAVVAMLLPRRWASWPSALATMGWRLAVWAACCRIPRTHTGPGLVMWPWRTLRSELRTWGSARPRGHSLRAEGKRPSRRSRRPTSSRSAGQPRAGSSAPGPAGRAWPAQRSRAPAGRWGWPGQPATHSSHPPPHAAPVAGRGRPARPARDRSNGPGPGRCHGRPAPHAPGACRRSTAGPGWPGGAAAPADRGWPGARSRPRATDQRGAAAPAGARRPYRS
jgi:hypothetical protein